MGAPYALSSDLVSAWPAKSLEVAQYIDGQVPLLAMTQNAQTGTTYSFVAADFTKLVTLSNASPVAVTLPLEATVPWPTGTQLRLLNQGAGTVTVAGAVGVTINGTPLTLAQYKGANLIKTGTNTWTFVPFASGVGAAVYSDANTGTYTGFAYKTFTSSGTLTVTTAGFADVVVCGGGGGGGSTATVDNGGGGAGGQVTMTSVYLPAGTLTVTIGAGGAVNTRGNTTRLNDWYAVGGGPGGRNLDGHASTGFGGSGGGGSDGTAPNNTAGLGVPGQGSDGGPGANSTSWGTSAGGGGGGATAVGGTGTLSVGGAGGAGTSTTWFGTTPASTYSAGSFAYAGGGGGGRGGGSAGAGGSGGGGPGGTTGGTAGTANTGGGGGGAQGAQTQGLGGSGWVAIRVAV
jgi:hypothetical protein